jgi:hypothetical protein
VGLADARRAEQHHVLLALDEVELVQALDLLALEREPPRDFRRLRWLSQATIA